MKTNPDPTEWLASTILILCAALLILAFISIMRGCVEVKEKGLKRVLVEAWEGPISAPISTPEN